MAAKKRQKKPIEETAEYARVLEAYHRVTFADLAKWGAHGVGVGFKVVGGVETGKLALRIRVPKILPRSVLGPQRAIPSQYSYLAADGQTVVVPTDVMASAPTWLQSFDPTDPHDPMPGGVQCQAEETGTIGGWVWDTTDDSLVILSNAHVFGVDEGGSIYQPSKSHAGAMEVAHVKRAVPWKDSPSVNTVDAAIGDPATKPAPEFAIPEIGGAVFAVEKPTLKMEVEKYGAKTGHTFGVISDLPYKAPSGDYLWEELVYIEPDETVGTADWSGSGDSGALVFARDVVSGTDIKPAIGLHMGGDGLNGVACQIDNVFAQLDLTTLCDGMVSALIGMFFSGSASWSPPPGPPFAGKVPGPVPEPPAIPLPSAFVRRQRERAGSRTFHGGMARELEERLRGSARGGALTDFASSHRSEIASLLLEGDVVRAAAFAIQPMLAGSVTTTDVLTREITEDDVERIGRLVREVNRFASRRLKDDVALLVGLLGAAVGSNLADVLGVDLDA